MRHKWRKIASVVCGERGTCGDRRACNHGIHPQAALALSGIKEGGRSKGLGFVKGNDLLKKSPDCDDLG